MQSNLPTPESRFLRTMEERGFLHQITAPEELENFFKKDDKEILDGLMMTERVAAYIGFDCTADSLHVGSLVQIMMLRWLQKFDHKPIVLMGGGTTKIGDPSGKDSQRPLLTTEDIEYNKNGIRRIFEKYLRFGSGKSDAIMLDNAEWLDGLNYIELLRDYGVHFPMTQMLGMESVKTRLERNQNMSFLEFNYAILQAYDFMELNRRHGCILQMGGSDQWGNIVAGIDLTRRMNAQQVFGLTSPLLTTASGAKMGKTAEGAVWLNKDKTPVWEFWQYWRNTEDADVGRFLRLFTELPMEEIARLEALQGSDINEAKIILANEVTALCHSREEAIAAAKTAAETFGGGGGDSGSLPTAEIESGAMVIDALCAIGFAKSKSEARRLITGGGARINDKVIADSDAVITAGDFDSEGKVKISAGKKRHGILSRRKQ